MSNWQAWAKGQTMHMHRASDGSGFQAGAGTEHPELLGLPTMGSRCRGDMMS